MPALDLPNFFVKDIEKSSKRIAVLTEGSLQAIAEPFVADVVGERERIIDGRTEIRVRFEQEKSKCLNGSLSDSNAPSSSFMST